MSFEFPITVDEHHAEVESALLTFNNIPEEKRRYQGIVLKTALGNNIRPEEDFKAELNKLQNIKEKSTEFPDFPKSVVDFAREILKMYDDQKRPEEFKEILRRIRFIAN